MEAARGLRGRLVSFTEMRANPLAAARRRSVPPVGVGRAAFLVAGTQPRGPPGGTVTPQHRRFVTRDAATPSLYSDFGRSTS